MPYSTKTDLLTGDIPLPGYLSPDRYVQDAADEIDSALGVIYETPIDVSDDSSVARPAKLLLKRINNFLATGRLLMAVAAPSEDANLHAYAYNLVKEAQAAISGIAQGDFLIEGASRIQNDDTEKTTGPRIKQQDATSAVEMFYRKFMPQTTLVRPIPIEGVADWAPYQ